MDSLGLQKVSMNFRGEVGWLPPMIVLATFLAFLKE